MAEEPIDQRTYRDIFGEQRWIIGIAAIIMIVFIGGVALALRTSGGEEAEPISSVAIVAAEPGSTVQISRTTVTPTQLQLSGLTGQQQLPQTVIVLDEAILFEFDEATLRPGAEAELERILGVIRRSGDERVDVVGYTDAVSPQSYNLPLSRDRADTVARWLVDRGVNPRRLDVDWRGELDPVAPNTRPDGQDNPEGRQLNRRVEIRIDGPAIGSAAPPASGLGQDSTVTGATLVVDRVRVDPTAVLLDIRFVNRAPYPVRLNDSGMWLIDDTGATYRFVPSPQNPALDVPADSSLSGQLSFPGVVPPQATRVTLITNAAEAPEALEAAHRRTAGVLAFARDDVAASDLLAEPGAVQRLRDALRALDAGSREDPTPTLIVAEIPLRP